MELFATPNNKIFTFVVFLLWNIKQNLKPETVVQIKFLLFEVVNSINRMNPKRSILRIYLVIILILLTLDLYSSQFHRRRNKMKRRNRSPKNGNHLNCQCGYFKHNYKVK